MKKGSTSSVCSTDTMSRRSLEKVLAENCSSENKYTVDDDDFHVSVSNSERTAVHNISSVFLLK